MADPRVLKQYVPSKKYRVLFVVRFFLSFSLRIPDKMSFLSVKCFGYRKPHIAVDFFVVNWTTALEYKIDAAANNCQVSACSEYFCT